MNVDTLHALEDTIRKDVPDFKVAYKDESTLMKLIGFLGYPFNPGFMTTYSTTLGTTVYFPSRAYYEGNVANSLDVLSHEYVHLWDKKQGSTAFGVAYFTPQVFAVAGFVAFAVLARQNAWLMALPIVGYLLGALVAKRSLAMFVVLLGLSVMGAVGLAAWLMGWSALSILAGLVFLVPWPSPGRTSREMRGYTMSIAVAIWLGQPYTSEVRERFIGAFVGPAYYFMSWSRSTIGAALDDAAAATTSGALQGRSPPYAAIYDFLYQHSLLAPVK